MRIKNTTDIEIKPCEWLFLIAVVIIIMLLLKGDLTTAIETVSRWLPKAK